VEITRLRYFCALAETQSVRKAAELLHVSPGALSKALAQTEEAAGAPLFARVGRTIALTDAGRRFHARAARVVAEYDALHRPVDDAPGELRIGSFEVFTTHLLGHVVAASKETALLALEVTPGRMEEAVRENTVDFGITYAPVAIDGVEHVPVGKLTMGIFGRPSWVAAPFPSLPFAVPITSVGGHVAGFQSLDAWPSDVPRLVRFRCEMLETALVLARNEQAVLHCPSFVVSLSNIASKTPLMPIPLPKKMKAVTATVYLVKRASEPETPRLRAWAKAIQSVMRE
jgi:DNA-binding transcriptional LysR family regulator